MESIADAPELRIQVLGGFLLTYDGEQATGIETPRLQSLITYLLLHRGVPQSRHRLAFLFWPDSPESQALTNLRNLLYRLRQDLPDADRFVYADRNVVQWRVEAPYTLDVAWFEEALDRADEALHGARPDRAAAREALEKAVDVYEGDLLPSCYEDWIESDRERLRQDFKQALERLTGLLEDLQAYRAAIRHAERLVRHEPLREASYRRLMRLRALTGDRGGALRTYHKCARVMERELGVQPGPATRQMYERLLAADEPPTRPAVAREQMAWASPLVGRQEAWAHLRRTWRVASAGPPRAALISGEAGIGKTRLAEEMMQWARRQGVTTATARCYAAEGELAYAPVAAWLRALPLPRMEDVWLSELARILPELLADQPDLLPPGPIAEPWQRGRFMESLTRAVMGGDAQMLLVIDGLQWCDRGTFEWLHYLLRQNEQAGILVVGAYRPGDVGDGHPLRALRHALRETGQVTEIELGPLSKAETATLAENVANRDLGQELTDCLYAETEGNPLFIVETVRAGLPDEVRRTRLGDFLCMPHPIPSRMRDALEARINQLSASARGLAELAATVGREFTFDVLREATDAGEGILVRGLDELWQRRIVREQGQDAYDFSHDKLREVIYESLSVARRRMLHRHVASALERVYADHLDAVAGRVAAHYERADEPGEAISYYQRAAAVAERMQIEEDVDRYYRRISDLEGSSID